MSEQLTEIPAQVQASVNRLVAAKELASKLPVDTKSQPIIAMQDESMAALLVAFQQRPELIDIFDANQTSIDQKTSKAE